MKKTLIMMAVAAIGLTSCQKDELVQPKITVNQPVKTTTTTNVIDTLDYTLDFRCDTLNINITNLHPYQVKNINAGVMPTPNMLIGKVFYFKQNGSDFTIWYKWDGTRAPGDVSGNSNGHTFGDITVQPTNGTLNMCTFAQNVPYVFTLKNYRGEVVMTNASNALSK